MTETEEHSLMGPFNGLESRKIPNQDDSGRVWILITYSLFLLAGFPIWWYCTNVPSTPFKTVNMKHHLDKIMNKQMQFKINLYFENSSIKDRCLIKDSFQFENYTFDISVQHQDKHIDERYLLDNDDALKTFEFNLLLKNGKDLSKTLKSTGRTFVIPVKDSGPIDLKNLLLDLQKNHLDPLKVSIKPIKIVSSIIKLKFTLLTPKFIDWNVQPAFEKQKHLNEFLKALSPALNFQIIFQTKFYDSSYKEANVSFTLNAEMFVGPNPIVKLNGREERGRGSVYNFVLYLKDSLLTSEESSIFIPHWGAVYSPSHSLKNDQEIISDLALEIFHESIRKLLGFSTYHPLEIDFWMIQMEKSFLNRSFELFSQLEFGLNDSDGLVLSPALAKNKLDLAVKLFHSSEIENLNIIKDREIFELIDSVFHDPSLLGAPYFPSDHKFAVYLPVYLPLFLPVLVALITYLKELRARRKKKKNLKSSKSIENKNGNENDLKNNKIKIN